MQKLKRIDNCLATPIRTSPADNTSARRRAADHGDHFQKERPGNCHGAGLSGFSMPQGACVSRAIWGASNS